MIRVNRIRKEYIRGAAQAERLEDQVREARLRWVGHLQSDGRYVGQRMSARSRRQRPEGRLV